MQIIFFSLDTIIIDEWKKRHNIQNASTCSDVDSVIDNIDNKDTIFIGDYDSVASEINLLISSNKLPKKFIVMERAPEIVTGKMLISHGVKAYGNSRMLTHHYTQMINTVSDNNIWTYPELTAALIDKKEKSALSSEAIALIEHRLSQKEKEVVFLILEGLTNNAISAKLNITIRTVKAHTSSIFSKLHVNDRVALILLLK
jgi:DNA-binding NarL/FixJ family response regulator